jgi:nitrogen fixation NifU-like protein
MKDGSEKYDVNNDQGNWIYSDVVKDHFFNPRNIVEGEMPEWKFDGVGEVGSPACGDVMRFWIMVENGKITKCGWKTFGCASAIASTSILSEMTIGRTLDEAKNINAKEIVEKLGGLPINKIHCSVLGDQALRAAIINYEENEK